MNSTLSFQIELFQVLIVALVLGLSFHLNTILFENTSLNVVRGVDLIFLPAFIKMSAVVIFGWRGAVGLLFGIIPFSDYDREISIILIDLLMFAFGPMIAFLSVKHMCSLPETLAGLKPKHIFYLAVVAALIQSLNKYIHHQSFSLSCDLFCGDMIGTVIMLLLLSVCMRGYEFFTRKRSNSDNFLAG